MRLVFAGTPYFAQCALAGLIAAGHEIKLVLTQPDRKAGRGMKTSAPPVKELARTHGMEVFQPLSARDPAVAERLRDEAPDALIVVAYGLILPQAMLDVPKWGAFNIHASLLPRWRGAAPVQRALLAGDTSTGITIMQMDAGLDTGPTLARSEVTIAPGDTSGSLMGKLADVGARLIVEVLEKLRGGGLKAEPQATEGVTYAHKIEKSEAALDWRASCLDLDRAVRAFNPAPGAHAVLNGEVIKVWGARPGQAQGAPGCVQTAGPEGVVVSCGEGSLTLTELQRAGSKRLAARDFLRGHPIVAGARFALPA